MQVYLLWSHCFLIRKKNIYYYSEKTDAQSFLFVSKKSSFVEAANWRRYIWTSIIVADLAIVSFHTQLDLHIYNILLCIYICIYINKNIFHNFFLIEYIDAPLWITTFTVIYMQLMIECIFFDIN